MPPMPCVNSFTSRQRCCSGRPGSARGSGGRLEVPGPGGQGTVKSRLHPGDLGYDWLASEGPLLCRHVDALGVSRGRPFVHSGDARPLGRATPRLPGGLTSLRRVSMGPSSPVPPSSRPAVGTHRRISVYADCHAHVCSSSPDAVISAIVESQPTMTTSRPSPPGGLSAQRSRAARLPARGCRCNTHTAAERAECGMSEHSSSTMVMHNYASWSTESRIETRH